MTVGGVGVRAAVDGAARGGGDALAPAPRAQEQDGQNDGDHQNQAGHGDADGEVARRNAQLVLVLLKTQKKVIKIASFWTRGPLGGGPQGVHG